MALSSARAVWLAIVGLLVGVPSTPGFAASWSLPADPAVNAVVPAARERFELALSKSPRLLVVPQHPSDFVLVIPQSGDSEVISLSEGKSVGRITSKIEATKTEWVALNQDGTRMLAAVNGFSSNEFDVWDTTRGKLVQRIAPGGNDRRLGLLAFVDNDRAVSCPGVDGKQSLTIWDLKTGDAVRTFATPVELTTEVVAVSPGGKYLAVAALRKNLLLVYDLSTGQLLQQLSYPAVAGFWDDCHGLAFSPDGSELAALSNGKPSHLRVWHLPTGTQTVDAATGATPHGNLQGRPSYNGRRFAWVPDGSGWLCYGYFWIDRATQRLVRDLQVKVPFVMPTIHPVGPESLVYVAGNFRTGVLRTQTVAKLPTELFNDGSQPLFQPGDSVALQIEVGDVRFTTAEAVEKTIRAGLTQRVKELGFSVADAAPVTLKVSYKESAGKLLPRPKPQNTIVVPRPPRVFGRGPQLGETGPGQGTGFLVSPSGHVVTCAHVVAKAPEMTVKLGSRKVTAKVLIADEKSDLAILKFAGENEPYLHLRDSDQFELGEDVRAVGYPLSDVLGDSLKVTKGSLSGLIKKGDRKLFMIDANVNPGNSGGPLIDQRGRVLGVNAQLLVGPEIDNVGMSLPINLLRPLLEKPPIELPKTPADDAGLTGADLFSRLEATVAMILPPGAADPTATAISEDNATSTEFACDVALLVTGREQPVWKTSLNSESRVLVVQGAWNDENLRLTSFRQYEQRVKSLFMPYYISADAALQLPEQITINTTMEP